jgi:xanthine dehydrogenase accessory factor
MAEEGTTSGARKTARTRGGDEAAIFEEAARLERDGVPATLCTVVGAEGSTPRAVGARMIVYPGGRTYGTIGGGSLEKHVTDLCRDEPPGTPRVVDLDLAGDVEMACGGAVSVLLEPLGRSPRLVVFGAGHIARALAPMAAACGFRLTLVDDLPEYASPERFPDVESYVHSFEPSDWERITFDERTYCVIVTRGHDRDLEVLRALVDRDLAYVGMIGSKTKVAETMKALREEGMAQERLERVCAPIGLDIGSETPAEIAVSILAQLVRVRRTGRR